MRKKPWENSSFSPPSDPLTATPLPPSSSAAVAADAPSLPATTSPTAAPNHSPVQHAVRFLTHPTTAQMPLASARAFLLSKGLSASDIDLAVERAHRPSSSAETSLSIDEIESAPTIVASSTAEGTEQTPKPLIAHRPLFRSEAAAIGATALGATVVIGRWISSTLTTGDSSNRMGLTSEPVELCADAERDALVPLTTHTTIVAVEGSLASIRAMLRYQSNRVSCFSTGVCRDIHALPGMVACRDWAQVRVPMIR
jgi:hypothetical protein